MICKFPARGYRQNYKLGPKKYRFITFSFPIALFFFFFLENKECRKTKKIVFKCLFDLFSPHSFMQLQKNVNHFIILIIPYRISEHPPVRPKKESASSFSQIMLTPRPSSKFWCWKCILTLQTYQRFILNSATHLFVWRNLSKPGFNHISFVLGLSGMELIFFTAACMVLCTGFITL